MARLRPAASMVTAIALGALLSAATPEEEVYLRGMEAHNNQQWSLATQEFERILRGGYEAELLYYNLGNAYYRAGDVAGAVWAYEKVLLLNPNDADARYNLALVNLRVKDRIELPEMPWFMRLYRGTKGSLTPGEWLGLASLLLLVASMSHAAGRLFQRVPLQVFAWSGIFAAALLFIVAVDAILTAGRTREGIVYGEVVTVTSGPSARSTQLFEIHEGLKVAILEQRDDWLQIELLDGKAGWLPSAQVRAL